MLVFGAGTDYALLLTARYREELLLVDDKYEAMRIALQQGGPAIVAVLFGFFLASTGMAPSINRFMNSIADTINQISF